MNLELTKEISVQNCFDFGVEGGKEGNNSDKKTQCGYQDCFTR